MTWAWIVGAVIALSAGTLALGASVAVVRSAALGSRQKCVQLTAVWLLPLIGPMFVLNRLQKSEPGVIPRELVAASGLGWGLLGDEGRNGPGRARGHHGRADGTDDEGDEG